MAENPLVNRVMVPGLIALVTGLFVASGVLSYCWLAGKPAAWSLAAFAGGSLAAWLFRPQPGGLHMPDLPATAKQSTVTLRILSDDGNQGDYLDLDVDPARLRQLGEGLASGKRLDVRTWTGRGAPFSGSEFARLRGKLIDRGLAKWVSDRDPRGGVVMTARGLATMRGLAALPSPKAG